MSKYVTLHTLTRSSCPSFTSNLNRNSPLPLDYTFCLHFHLSQTIVMPLSGRLHARFFSSLPPLLQNGLLSRAVTAFSSGYHARTTIPELKVEPSVPGHRARTKEGPLVPVDVTNRD